MRNLSRVLFVVFIICLVGTILTFQYLIEIFFQNENIIYQFNVLSILAIVFFVLTLVVGIVFYVKFLLWQPYGNFIFFVSLPLTLIFMGVVYILFLPHTNENLHLIQVTVFTGQNAENISWWLFSIALLYLILMFFLFWVLSLPIKKIQKVTNRLGDGVVNGKIIIGKNRQFKDIEFSLNKINENYKENLNKIKKTNLEVEKYIPKQFLKYFGVSNILELDIGNKVQKEVTTMFCNINNSHTLSLSMSLEENFNFINAYLNLISPLIRKYNGFVDKYLGDGIMAIFQKPEHAIVCSKSIFSAINTKNFAEKKMPLMNVSITIDTGEVVFGVVGEENRKSLTILADSVSLAGKMVDVNKFFKTHVIFSKNTLNELPYGYELNYRFVGSIKNSISDENFYVFENLDIYTRLKREKLVFCKNDFEKGVRLYDQGDYANAKIMFSNALKKFKDDKVCYIYFNLCDEKINFEKKQT